MKKRSKKIDVILLTSIVLVMLLFDQITKIYVKTHFYYGESREITDWFYLAFIENNGMAFGTQILPKSLLTIIRLSFAFYLIWYLYIMHITKHKFWYLCSVALIIAGAFGNICDNIFYGKLFTSSGMYEVSQMTFFEADSSPWFYGKVVDMLYFPLLEFDWPMFLPFIGGEHFIFFSPIFNVADAAVSCGTIILLLFYPKTLVSSFRLIALITKHKLRKHVAYKYCNFDKRDSI